MSTINEVMKFYGDAGIEVATINGNEKRPFDELSELFSGELLEDLFDNRNDFFHYSIKGEVEDGTFDNVVEAVEYYSPTLHTYSIDEVTQVIELQEKFFKDENMNNIVALVSALARVKIDYEPLIGYGQGEYMYCVFIEKNKNKIDFQELKELYFDNDCY